MWRMKPRIFGFITRPLNLLKPPLGVPIRKLRWCLVGVFKQHNIYFHNTFSPTRISKKLNNFIRTTLLNGPLGLCLLSVLWIYFFFFLNFFIVYRILGILL